MRGESSDGSEAATGVVGAVRSAAVLESPGPVRPIPTSVRRFATSTIVGRSVGDCAIIESRMPVSGPLRTGGLVSPDATRCSTAIGLASLPEGGSPSTTMNSVAPSEYTSDAKSEPCPRATSGAR